MLPNRVQKAMRYHSPMTKSLSAAAPSNALSLQAVLRRYHGKGGGSLLPCLHDVQAITGWLDENTCMQVADSLDIPLVQVHNVIEFYTLFYGQPVGKRVVRVCDDLACYLAGSQEVVHACASRLGVDAHHGGTSVDGEWTLEMHPCLGRCEQAPFLMIDDDSLGHVRADQVDRLLDGAGE